MLVCMFEWGIKQSHLTTNPSAEIRPARVYADQAEVDIFTEDECRRLIAVSPTLRETLHIQLGLHEALRPIEMSRMVWADLVAARLRVRGKGGGGNVTRTVPLTVATLRTMDRYRQWQDMAYGSVTDELPLLHNSAEYGRPLVVATVLHNITGVLRAAGIKPGCGKSPYSMRHTALTAAAEVDLLTARDLPGQQSDRHLHRYTKQARSGLANFQADRITFG